MEIAERKSILEKCIAYYVRNGYRVGSQNDTSVQMVKPKTFSLGLAIILFLIYIVPFIIYLLYYLSQKEKTAYIMVDERGGIVVTDESGVARSYSNADTFLSAHPTGSTFRNAENDPGLTSSTKIVLAVLVLIVVSICVWLMYFS